MDITDDILHHIKQLRLMDDVLMVRCFENSPECADLLLQLILKKPVLQSKTVTAQWDGPSVGLSISATDSGGQYYKVKVFRNDTADETNQTGLALYSSDLEAVRTGQCYQDAEYYVIYIIEHGAIRKSVYRSGIMLDGIGDEYGWYGFAVKTFYVNGDRKNRSPLGKLMYDFSCTDPAYMNYALLADKVRYFKEDKQGIQATCELLEQKRQNLQKYLAPKDR